MIAPDGSGSDADFAAGIPPGTFPGLPGMEKTMMVPCLRSDSKIGAIKQLVDRLPRAFRTQGGDDAGQEAKAGGGAGGAASGEP